MTSTIPDQCSACHSHSSLLHRSIHSQNHRLCSSKTIRQHRHWQPNLEGLHRPHCRRLCLLRASAAVPNETASARPGRGLAGCKLAGCGSSAPSAVLTNADLEKLVDTDDDWIRQRTGIRQRHILGRNENLSDHAAKSAQLALEMAGVAPEDVDMILLATSSPDDLFGSACQVQQIIGARNATAMDLTAACSGFVLGVVTAAQFIRTGMCRNILVIGADALSRYVDWRDRSTCILFGDGSGAVLMTQQDEACSLLGADMHSNGDGQKHLNCYFSGADDAKALSQSHASSMGAFHNIAMNGQDVFRFAVSKVPETLKSSLKDAGMNKDQLDWLVLHQANQRILDAAAKKLDIDSFKVVSNLADYGNTSAASIPLVLDERVRDGTIKSGDVLALAGFGAGLTWGSAIVRWHDFFEGVMKCPASC